MHATDDVHARGAAMVARAAADVPPVNRDREIANLVQAAVFAKQVLRAQHKKHGAVVCRLAMLDLADAVRRLEALNDSDAALARAFDEA